jgi:tetratricopeptide (TPR) repeat protein
MKVDALSFEDVCAQMKEGGKHDPKLIEAIDHLFGFAIVCSPILIGPAGAALLPILAVKNELVKVGKAVFEKVAGNSDDNYLAHEDRMQMAYGLICFTAFFAALDEQIPKPLRQQIGLMAKEKRFLADSAMYRVGAESGQSLSDQRSNPVTSFRLSLDAPKLLEDQLKSLWEQMAQGFSSFVEKLAFWEDAKEQDRTPIRSALKRLPEKASEHFKAQYHELAQKFPDFAIWANFQEHEATQEGIVATQEGIHDISRQVKRAGELSSARDAAVNAKLERIIARLEIEASPRALRGELRRALANYLTSDDSRGAEIASLLEYRKIVEARQVAVDLAEDHAELAARLGAAASTAVERAAESWRDAAAIALLSDEPAAAAAYEKALALAPDDPVGWGVLGRIYQHLDRLPDAEQAFNMVVQVTNDAGFFSATDAGTTRDVAKRWRDHGEIVPDPVFWAAYFRALSLLNLGEIARMRGDFAVAEDLLARALALNRVLGSEQVELINLENLEELAGTAHIRGDLAAEEEYIKRLLAVSEGFGGTDSRASTLRYLEALGGIALNRGDLTATEGYLKRALAINEEIESDVGAASSLNNLGMIAGMRGDLQAAEEYLRRSLAVTEGQHTGARFQDDSEKDPGRTQRRALELKELSAHAQGNLGVVAQKRGDLAGACASWARSMALYREIGQAKAAEGLAGRMRAAGCPEGNE